MKTNLLKRKKGRLDSSLLLRTFSLLALLVVGIGASWAQTVISTFSMPTENPTPAFEDAYVLGDNNGITYFAQGLKDGSGNHVTRVVDGQTYRKLQDNDIEKAHIKLQFASGTIKVGDVLSITCVQVYGTNPEEVGYEMGGSGTNVTGNYEGTPVTLTHIITTNEIIDNGDGTNEYIRIGRWDWKQSAYGTITVTRPAGFTVTFGPNASSTGMGTLTATVGGNPITSGTRVPSGTQVQFTATPSSSDYRHWGYDVNGSRDWGFQNPYTVTADVKVEANFTPGIKLNAYPNNGNWGSINISGGGESGTSIHITPYPGTVTFTATPNAGYKFVGWYEDVDCNNLATSETTLTYTNSDAILTNSGTINRWAKFEVDNSGPKTIGKPECDCTGARTGINLFPLDKLNAQQNLTLETVAGGVKVTLGSYDRYVSFVFDNAYNLSDLAGWTIGDNATVQGNVTAVEFYNGENNIRTYNQDAGNRTSIADNLKAELTSVTEIRIYFKSGTESVVSKFEFRIQHGAWTAPTLSGISNDMKLYVGAPLNLDITNNAGFWREYTDGNYNNELTTSVLYNTYNPRYTFEANTLTVGQDYYFGVKDGRSCALGNYHFSDMVKVHVRVVAQELYDVKLRTQGGYGKAGDMTVTDVNTDNSYTITTHANTQGNDGDWDESHSFEKGHMVRVAAVEYLGSNNTVLKYWKVTRAKDPKKLDGETETKQETTGIPTSGIAYQGVNRYFEFASTGMIKSVQADYGRAVRIEIPAVVNGVGKISFEGNETYDVNTAFREDTELQLKAYPSDENHKLDHWTIVFKSGDAVLKTIDSYSTQKVADIKLDRSLSGGGYDRIIATPVFVEGTEWVNEVVNITVNDENRNYRVYVPTDINGKAPVLFSLHGKGGSNDTEAAEVQNGSKLQNFNAIADAEKFIVIYPQGKVRNGSTDWLADGTYNEDVQFFDAIIDEIGGNYSIDYDRIYMTGFAEGGAMTYSTAFTSKKFAGFASVTGFPNGSYHLQHYGSVNSDEWQGVHPVPFMHIQSAASNSFPTDKAPTIIDNMVYRNGCNPVPTETTVGASTKYAYAAAPGGFPIEYYKTEVGYAAVTCGINGTNSRNVIWNFVKQFNRTNQSDYANRSRIEFMPNVEKFTAEYPATAHGWKSDIDGADRIILQYGDKPSDYVDANGNHTDKVYHTIQLGKGAHQFQFTSSSSAANTSTLWVNVIVEKVGKINPTTGAVTSCSEEVINRNYNIGAVSFNIKNEDDCICEYRITFKWNNSDTSDLGIANGKAITISGISFQHNNGQDRGKQHGEISTHYERFFPYHNRLIAQWNFDLADAVCFNYQSLSSSYWRNESGIVPVNGVVTFSYINDDMKASPSTPVELTYDGTTPIAVAAGLKFYSPDPSKVQIQVTMENGVMTKSQLVLDAGVKMTVPYVRNTYRSSKSDKWNTADIPAKPEDEKKDVFDDFSNSLHHINRDIIYISSSPIAWDAIDNWVDGEWNEKFFTGGQDNIEGKMYEKLNYLGDQDGPCVIDFVDKITIDRIGVNRNLIASFYTEYIYEETGIIKPYPGFRYIGSPAGFKVADVEATNTTYNNAIAMTFGGWQYNSNQYKDMVNDTPTEVSDVWNELNVYQGGTRGEGSQNRKIGKIDDLTTVPIASDGFPVYSRMERPARSENVNPDTLDVAKYYDNSDGLFKLTTDNGGSYAYKENYTPWSLPARGAHVKFEPTLPGVLNIDVLMKGGSDYWIADEFGKMIPNDKVFVKTGTTGSSQSVNRTNGHYQVAVTDYVKLSLDVYPGKTYYLFSNNGDLGMAGFYFEPYVYRKSAVTSFSGSETDREKEAIELDRNNVGMWTATLGANSSGVNYTWDRTNPHGYTNQNAFVKENETGYPTEGFAQEMNGYGSQNISYDNKAVHVIYERNFTEGKWQTICLPYSMNNLQMKEQFGENAKVVMLRDVQLLDTNNAGNTTAYFVYHMNQDIIAGYPYLIWPSKSTSRIETNAYLGEGASTEPSSGMTPLTIDGKGPNLVTFPTEDNTYGGLGCYKFVANFKTGVTVPKGSYVMSGGNLVRLNDQTGTITASPFMGYLEYNGPDFNSPAAAKYRIASTNYIDVNGEAIDEATSIDDLLLESGIVGDKTNVYSVNGQLVRQNTDDLSGLAKGIYIVNGKKYIVR